MYLGKLNPKLNALFQRPARKMLGEGDVWYENMVLGGRYLAELIKGISKDAQLSCIYTNHSIRATTVTNLDKAGIEARHMSVSGHQV